MLFKSPGHYYGLVAKQYMIVTFVTIKSWSSFVCDEFHKLWSLDIIH